MAKENTKEQNSEKYFTEKEYIKTLFEFHKIDTGLYWKRATYFWAFIGAIFGAYFIILNPNNTYDFNLKLLIEAFGAIFSFGWYCVNRGSHYWITKWETLLKENDNELIKKLFEKKDVENLKWHNLFGPYHFSVLKINHLLSFFVFLIWVFLLIKNNCENYILNFNFQNIDCYATAINIMVVIFIVLILIFGRNSKQLTKQSK